MEYRYTKHQVPRGARPDAETRKELFLIKRVSEMRATYQVRVLTYMASETGRKLIIEVPKDAKIHPSLQALKKEFPSVLKIVRV